MFLPRLFRPVTRHFPTETVDNSSQARPDRFVVAAKIKNTQKKMNTFL